MKPQLMTELIKRKYHKKMILWNNAAILKINETEKVIA